MILFRGRFWLSLGTRAKLNDCLQFGQANCFGWRCSSKPFGYRAKRHTMPDESCCIAIKKFAAKPEIDADPALTACSISARREARRTLYFL